jgi:hypothetical protein
MSILLFISMDTDMGHGHGTRTCNTDMETDVGMDTDTDMQLSRFNHEKTRGEIFCDPVSLIAGDGRKEPNKIYPSDGELDSF